MNVNKPLVFSIIIFFLLGCSTTEPLDNGNIIIKVIDVGVKEAYFKISSIEKEERELILMRNNVRLEEFLFFGNDTVISDTTLVANKNYVYQLIDVNRKNEKSNKLTITTLKPSSSLFTWSDFEINSNDQSILSDLFVINENDIWCVGEFYFDSLIPYGFVHWDGISWNPIRMYTKVPPTNYDLNIIPSGVYAFTKNDIWFVGGGVFHWDGNGITPYWLSNFDGNPNPLFEKGQFAREIWGDPYSKEIYVCGDKGAIAYYKNNIWNKVNTDTNDNLVSVWGYTNELTNRIEVLFCGINITSAHNTILKFSTYSNLEYIQWEKSIYLSSIWTNKGFPIFLTGTNIYSNKSGLWDNLFLSENFESYKINGTALNDIFISGSSGYVFHFNGENWAKIELNFEHGGYLTQLFVNKNIIVVGGENNGSVNIYITKR